MPLSATCCGCPAASSLMTRMALRFPEAAGANATLTAHPFPEAIKAGQFEVARKEPGFVPATLTPEKLSEEPVPLFVSVTLCFALVDPSGVAPKATLDVLSVARGGAGTVR